MLHAAEAARAQGEVYPLALEMRIGSVCDSALATVKVTIEPSPECPRTGDCQVGQYVLIDAGELTVFAQVNGIKLEETASGARVPTATIALLNTIDFATRNVAPGVTRRPQLGASAYLAHPSIVRMVAESRAKKNGNGPGVTLDLAVLSDGYDTPIEVTPEMLFGRHMAILGTTGGGKSFTLTRLIEEVARYNSKAILFDPSGEFGTIESGALHVYVGNHPNPPPHLHEVVVPYFELMENDLFSIFRPSGEAQAPKLRQAIKSLKLARVSEAVSLGGYVIKANKSKQFFDQSYLDNIHVVEDPMADFDIDKLVRQIANECVFPNRSTTETGFWGDINMVELSLVTSLTNRVQDIVTSATLAPIFQPENKPSLFAVINAFLRDKDHRVLVVSMQYLSFEHSAREIVANAAGRHVLAMGRDEKFRERPILIAVDEAHQFLKERNEADKEFAMDSFALIAKEGRKYGLHICLATQRPRDIPESVLSQMGSLIVHRLINDQDRNIIERACGEANAAALNSLPILTSGQAVLLGAEFPVPLVVRVRMPQNCPSARSADFQKFWSAGGGVPAC